GRGPDQRWARLALFEVLADGGDLGEHRAVVQLQRRRLARRVDADVVGRLAVFAAHQVDVDAGDIQPLLSQEHLHYPRIGADRRVELHDASSDLDATVGGCPKGGQRITPLTIFSSVGVAFRRIFEY